MSPFPILAFALRRAWDEWISVILISAGWLAAQVLIIPGPPATAVLFDMARRTAEGEYWSATEVWASFKALFGRAWLWALPNGIIIGLALYNLSTFWRVPGAAWGGLRVVWLVGLLVWLGLNLFYWPFNLAAEDQSLRNTYANCARFWLLHPGAAFVLFLVCLVIGVAALPFALPIVMGVYFWIALVAETAVRRSLQSITN
jgi:hypothetical protein